jgi:hypothetical protein
MAHVFLQPGLGQLHLLQPLPVATHAEAGQEGTSRAATPDATRAEGSDAPPVGQKALRASSPVDKAAFPATTHRQANVDMPAVTPTAATPAEALLAEARAVTSIEPPPPISDDSNAYEPLSPSTSWGPNRGVAAAEHLASCPQSTRSPATSATSGLSVRNEGGKEVRDDFNKATYNNGSNATPTNASYAKTISLTCQARSTPMRIASGGTVTAMRRSHWIGRSCVACA